ncbi:MAG: YbaB/EbfC family nucleoid-associated protein [Candidatus Omnitrophica bacterium]|nr:YbaB/EbfC family nucleoid-associated protein [Candidatus Omnitrophota bacterium]
MANFMQSLKEINKLRQSAKILEKKLREERMDFSSRDGRVKGIINGKLEILSLEISPDLLSAPQKQNLEKLILETINNTVGQMQSQVSKIVSSQMGINLPGMGF